MPDSILERKIIELKSPKDSEQTAANFEQVLASLAATRHMPLWKSLVLGTRHPIATLETVTMNQTVHFYVTTPTYYQTYIESQLLAQYPRLLLTQTKDYMEDFFGSGEVVVGRITLGLPYYLPFRTYKDLKDVDPMGTILGVMSKAAAEQKMLVQYVLEPANPVWQTQARWVADHGAKDPTTGAPKPHPQAALIAQKITQSGFKVGIRIAASAPNKSDAFQLLFNLAGSFGVVASGEGNQLVYRRSTIWQKGRITRAIKHRTIGVTPAKQYLNIAELASLWHPPTMTVAGIRNLAWGRKYPGEPPANLPVALEITEEQKQEINFFAKTEFKNRLMTFGIKRIDRRRHVYIIGKTGTGKSTLIANMLINDMRNGEGVAVIDPHGDLSEILLNYIPSFRINDVAYLDPSDTAHPFHLNALEIKDPEHMELVASGFVAIFYKLYGHSWGPRLEYILRNCILTLLEVPNATMLMIPELLTNDEFRNKKIIPKIRDTVISNFWLHEFDKMHPRLKTEAISPILNKVGQFISSPMIRGIIGSPTSTIDLEEIMNQKKILILNLSQGKLGEDNAALLGAMFITKMQLAAMNRVHLPEAERKDFYLYVDEFQNFATTSFIKILSEARKYRLNLTLANQYIGQVLEDVQKAIFGNAGTLISFIVGAQDASLLAKEFAQVYKETELVSMGNYQIILKLAVDGITSFPFYATTLPLPKSKNKNREKVLRLSRERFTRKAKPREVAATFVETSQSIPVKGNTGVLLSPKAELILEPALPPPVHSAPQTPPEKDKDWEDV